MNLELSDEEIAALLGELDGIIANDRYFLSPRIMTLQAIRTKLRPEPKREPLPPLKHYDRASAGTAGVAEVERPRLTPSRVAGTSLSSNSGDRLSDAAPGAPTVGGYADPLGLSLSQLVTEAMIGGGPPSPVRLDRCRRLGTRL